MSSAIHVKTKMDGGLDWESVQELMNTDDESFERTVSTLTMRGLVDLVTGLQQAMAEEQHHFDKLSMQLRSHSNLDTQHKRISSALCQSQMRLAMLCSRNMRCFTQQAIRAKEDRTLFSRSSNSGEEDSLEDSDFSLTSMVPETTGGESGRDSQVFVFQPSSRKSLDIYHSQTTRQNFNGQKLNGEMKQVTTNHNSAVEPNDFPVRTMSSSGTKIGSAPNSLDSLSVHRIKCANHVSSGSCDSQFEVGVLSDQEDNYSVKRTGNFIESSSEYPSIESSDAGGLQEQFCSDLEMSRSSESIQEFESLERKYEAASDYDSKDFVVHRNTFSEELLSEDAYSSLNEDNDQDHLDESRQEPEIPSPDYGSSEDEGEYQVYHTGSDSSGPFNDEQQDEEDFVDNSASYRCDPRRYVYYPEEKELDTIPEEDEDMDDAEEYGTAYDDRYEEETDQTSEGHRDDDLVKAVSQTDGDSGVTDDQRSSAAESTDDDDFDKRSGSVADTDSAQGSMVPDCNSDLSPTFPDKIEDLHVGKGHGDGLYNLEISLGDKKVNGWDTRDATGDASTSADETRECVDAIEESFKQVLDVDDGSGDTMDRCSEVVEDVFTEPVIESAKLIPKKSQHVEIVNGHEVIGDQEVRDKAIEVEDEAEDVEDTRRPRSSTLNWDPTSLLKEMYRIEYLTLNGNTEDDGRYDIEGYLEKMPSGRKKATYWNPWKRRFFRVKDGSLYCYESSQSEKPMMTLQLIGGIVDTMENNMIGIDDRKGHYVAMKCSNEEEAEKWKAALLHHCCENSSLTFVQPVQFPLKSHKKVVIIDLGSCSTRAGILMDSPTLPQLFFPTVCATDKTTGEQVFGFEALLPDIRKNSTISFPVLPSAKITKYTMNVDALPGLLEKVFHDLNVDPKNYQVQLCVPRSFSLQTQIAVVKTLLERFGVKSVNLTHQAILTLYAYNATSGIVVDIGDRLDILPINEGYIVENGVTKLPYGGQRLSHHLQHALAQKHISLTSDVESYLVRHIIEQSCYVARNYQEELVRFTNDPDSMEKNISIAQYFQGIPPWESIPLDFGRFQAPEGLFNPDLWGLDSPGLHKLVHRAIQECSMDIRREMARSIYVSGGVTLLPGFVERLEAEVDKLTPPSVNPKVHASPYRYHMSYLGACRLASSDGFDQVSVTKDEWTRRGNLCLQKWHL